MARILVIDDDPLVRRLVIQMLTGAGHEPIEAGDGREGVTQFRVHEPELVITDILMPDQDGLETIRVLRGEAKRVPIVAMSASHPMYLDMARKFGADAAIAKPFRGADLIDVVDRLLDDPVPRGETEACGA